MKIKKDAFSLVELLVVVAIIGILSVILVPNVQEQLRKAKIAKTKALISSLSVTITTYKNDFGKYPESFDCQKLYLALTEQAKSPYEPGANEVRLVKKGEPIWQNPNKGMPDDRIERILQQAGVPSNALRAQLEENIFVDAWGNPIYYVSSEIYNPGGRTDFRNTSKRGTFKFDAPCAWEMREGKRYKPFNPTTFQLISFGPDETTITPRQDNGGIGSMIDTDKIDNDNDGYFDNEDRVRAGSIQDNGPEVVAEDDITNFM
ncbi:MAG TPA: prepilin-type N-terminal cleavage/methylation domain-containing protein [bacterium]|nr:prepilin-type N-terminal cleavage/methylation domain-containing protein [bacterium]HOL94754.1 prepilin-type N-terminal cleavage/methylation domain-containing protein [bacterium]HPP00625.1 prepilin-type N-terminal cleavage/methylation domain-containing protein [bacterium]HXK92210.1 prepilin-type N-terminal cleavage/methylation domain-containing protein [bacterium]